jgi:hypothetical protein
MPLSPRLELTAAPSQKLSSPCLKGQCHEIFDFWFFSWISFPQASEYTTTAISNFFENLRRYLRLKLHHRCQRHRWQMEKIFKQKNVNNFVWAPLGNRVNIYINFCHRCQQDKGNWRQNLPPVSLIPAAIGEVPQSVARKPPLPPPLQKPTLALLIHCIPLNLIDVTKILFFENF